MSRSLTAAVQTELANAATTPAYFVEILFSTPLRLSSRETLTWSGNSWLAWDVRVAGLNADAASSTVDGRLTLGDADNTLAALVLGEGIADRVINVWKFYGSVPAAADPVQVFAGVGDEADINPDDGQVTIGLVQRGGTTLYSPRRYITRAEGFNFLPATGSLLSWNGETIRLTREGA